MTAAQFRPPTPRPLLQVALYDWLTKHPDLPRPARVFQVEDPETDTVIFTDETKPFNGKTQAADMEQVGQVEQAGQAFDYSAAAAWFDDRLVVAFKILPARPAGP